MGALRGLVSTNFFTTKPLRSLPPGGAEVSEIDIRCIARGSARVQALDCGAPARRSDFAAGLILLSIIRRHHRTPSKKISIGKLRRPQGKRLSRSAPI